MQVRAGQERSKSFQQLVRRTGIEDIKALSAMIVQSERFGTSLAQSLKVYADSLRTRRRLRAEAIATRDALCARVETLDGSDALDQLVPIEEEWRSLLPLVGNGPEADRLAERFAQAVAACRKRHELGAQLAETRVTLETLVTEALQAGATDFIVKPFKPDAVLSTVRRVIEKGDA